MEYHIIEKTRQTSCRVIKHIHPDPRFINFAEINIPRQEAAATEFCRTVVEHAKSIAEGDTYHRCHRVSLKEIRVEGVSTIKIINRDAGFMSGIVSYVLDGEKYGCQLVYNDDMDRMEIRLDKYKEVEMDEESKNSKEVYRMYKSLLETYSQVVSARSLVDSKETQETKKNNWFSRLFK